MNEKKEGRNGDAGEPKEKSAGESTDEQKIAPATTSSRKCSRRLAVVAVAAVVIVATAATTLLHRMPGWMNRLRSLTSIRNRPTTNTGSTTKRSVYLLPLCRPCAPTSVETTALTVLLDI